MDLTLRGVRKTYRGGITALDRLDLDIPPGMLGMLGPSGAGKTTLMRLLAGVSRPDRGSVQAGGWDLARPRDRRQFPCTGSSRPRRRSRPRGRCGPGWRTATWP